jgi:hypothetical protein
MVSKMINAARDKSGGSLTRRFRQAAACVLGLLLLSPVIPAVPVVVTGALIASEAAAQRSSGGYSRPRSSGGYGRTPSVGGPRVTPRTPSTSGGYRRPDFGSTPQPRRPSLPPDFGSRSAGDRALSREQSGGALSRYRTQQEQARRPPMPAPLPTPAPAPGGGGFGAPGGGFGVPGGGFGVPRGGYAGGPGYSRPVRPDWYRDRGWFPQPGIFGAGRSFGVWDGLFLWFMLDNLTRAGSVDFFRNHRDDPAIREFRAEAERQARDNADLRARLDELDRQLARQPDAPTNPDYLPPGVPPEVAIAPRDDVRTPTTGATEGESGGIGFWVLPVLLVGGGGLVLLARRRRAAPTIGGSGMSGHGTGDRIRAAGGMLRNTVSGGDAQPSSPFRVGMTLQADPTPFILAAESTKVRAPDGVEASPLLSVQEVGRLRGAGIELTRLYLPDGRSAFQLHLDAANRPDECRFLGVIDEVSPADEAEWAVWLDPAEGLIGWPEFETKDGKHYARAWSPSDARIEPRELQETVEGLGGTRQRRHFAMLYAAGTGAADPAPQTEYILVSAVEEGSRAWVEIRAGIDINPATLSLA